MKRSQREKSKETVQKSSPQPAPPILSPAASLKRIAIMKYPDRSPIRTRSPTQPPNCRGYDNIFCQALQPRATDSVKSAASSATDVDHADTLSQHSDLIEPSTSRSGRLNSGDELIKTDAGVGTRL
ncbi:hypothetical protein E4U32_005182 [Claviceps aff. humidiphila group G2b]|nr:hypothetical protein E4U32_005182 [Claviceps aff. humidiphila group G2b]